MVITERLWGEENNEGDADSKWGEGTATNTSTPLETKKRHRIYLHKETDLCLSDGGCRHREPFH